MPDDQGPTGDIGGPSKANEGRGDRLALMRLYDGMSDEKKQELLRLAIELARKPTS